MRRTNRSDTKAKPVQFRKQGEVIRDVMLSAGQCATWLTLDELAKLTHYPPAAFPRNCGICGSRGLARIPW